MKVIVASDIFGKTPELEDIAAQLSSTSCRAKIVDPYDGTYQEFKNENEAYASFQQIVGIERYKDYILEIINQAKSDLLLIGFSVGASAIWALSEEYPTNGSIKAICFYGSQIRNYSNVNPKIEIEIFFPEHEPQFEVKNLISHLSRKRNVRCYMVPYRHGFMNKNSNNFNSHGYYHYLQILKAKVI